MGDRHAELSLARACAQGDAGALAAFEEQYLSIVPAAVRHLAVPADEVQQLLRVRFFVGPQPRILDYRGTGSLEGWVRAAAVRLAVDLKRKAAQGPSAVDPLVAADVELEHLKSAHGAAFQRAFEAACATLSSRERAVLRLSVLGGESIDRIAQLYGIHRATAARWLERIREALRERTLVALGASNETSLARVLVSGCAPSLERLLASTGAP